MAAPGVSTLGVLFGYGVETVAGTKPEKFTLLTRINQIGGISIDVETIDASALEDKVEKTVAGRGSTGGTFTVTVNVTDETLEEWEALIEAYKTGKTGGKSTWFETFIPTLQKAFYVVAEPPTTIPQPEFDQNGLLAVEMTLTINDYKGPDTPIKLTAGES